MAIEQFDNQVIVSEHDKVPMRFRLLSFISWFDWTAWLIQEVYFRISSVWGPIYRDWSMKSVDGLTDSVGFSYFTVDVTNQRGNRSRQIYVCANQTDARAFRHEVVDYLHAVGEGEFARKYRVPKSWFGRASSLQTGSGM